VFRTLEHSIATRPFADTPFHPFAVSPFRRFAINLSLFQIPLGYLSILLAVQRVAMEQSSVL
jgi:hypothetical protein